MDNLFNSVNFTVELLIANPPCLCKISYKSGHGAPPYGMQDKVEEKTAQKARLTLKAATLMGDGYAAGILVASIFISHCFK